MRCIARSRCRRRTPRAFQHAAKSSPRPTGRDLPHRTVVPREVASRWRRRHRRPMAGPSAHARRAACAAPPRRAGPPRATCRGCRGLAGTPVGAALSPLAKQAADSSTLAPQRLPGYVPTLVASGDHTKASSKTHWMRQVLRHCGYVTDPHIFCCYRRAHLRVAVSEHFADSSRELGQRQGATRGVRTAVKGVNLLGGG